MYPFPPPLKPSLATSALPPRHEPCVIYPAVFWPHTNHQVLIEAMAILKARGSKLHLLLTGAQHATFPAVIRHIEQRDLANCVHYAGHLNESQLSELISRSEAGVLPSLFEAISLTAYDAIRAGQPLTCSDREFFRTQCGERAHYFDPIDPVSIADAIETVTQPGRLSSDARGLSDALATQLPLETFAENLYKTYRLRVTDSIR